jgi:hypothetical protein
MNIASITRKDGYVHLSKDEVEKRKKKMGLK